MCVEQPDMTTGGDEFGIEHSMLARVSLEAMRATPLKNPSVRAHNLTNGTFWDAFGGSEYGILAQRSDHAVFAFHVGVAAADLGFGGEAQSWELLFVFRKV